MNVNKKKSIYDRLGGQMAIDLAVDKFFGKVQSDSQIKELFKSIDMKKLSKMMKSFLTMVFGGYAGDTI
jgi:hemoglobin